MHVEAGGAAFCRRRLDRVLAHIPVASRHAQLKASSLTPRGMDKLNCATHGSLQPYAVQSSLSVLRAMEPAHRRQCVCVCGGREDNPSGSLISRAGAGTRQERRRRARTRGCAREDELVRAGAAELLMELGCVAARAPCVVQRRRRLQQLELRAEGAGRRWPYGNHLTAIGPMAWRESRVAVRVAAESSACSCRGRGRGGGGAPCSTAWRSRSAARSAGRCCCAPHVSGSS